MTKNAKIQTDTVDPKAAGARTEAERIKQLQQRRAISVAPVRNRETAQPPADSSASSQGVVETNTPAAVPDTTSEPAANEPMGPVAGLPSEAGPDLRGAAQVTPRLRPSEGVSVLDAKRARGGAHPLRPQGHPDVVQPPASARLKRIPRLWLKTSFRLPIDVMNELRTLLLEARLNGRRKHLKYFIAEAVMDLPIDAGLLLELIDRHGDELNIGCAAGDEGYRHEGSVSLDISEEMSNRLIDLVEVLFSEGLIVDRKTLVGLAIVSRLREGSLP
jgi:hypothetical protein